MGEHEVRVAALGGEFRAELFEPEGVGPRPGVLVIHELFGVDSDMRRIARRFVGEGYAALVPDLYSGPGSRAACVARVLSAGLSGEGAVFDQLREALAVLAATPGVDASRLAVAGFCLGGGFALLLPLYADVAVTAPFYGRVPERAEQLSPRCPVVASYGGRDRIFGPQAPRLEAHLAALGVRHEVQIYPDAGHSFMSRHADLSRLLRVAGARGPMRVGYDHGAAEDAWQRVLAFFRAELRLELLARRPGA